MAIVVQCDRCPNNNSVDPAHGSHTMFDIRGNQMYQSQIAYERQLCDDCAIDMTTWIGNQITR